MTDRVSLGIQFWNQAFEWEELAAGASLVDSLGYDHLWSWEHVYACIGDPLQPTFDGHTLLAAWAPLTSNVSLGLLTGANTFRNPGLLAKIAVTLDHVSGGRAILGLGGGWFAAEHDAFGFEFGRSAGERLDWLEAAATALRSLLDGGEVTSAIDDRYRSQRLRLSPLPVQAHLPLLIGGAGERKTLRTVARHADMWNMAGVGDTSILRHKVDVLRRHCEAIGRDPEEIRRSVFINPVIRDSESAAWRAAAEQADRNRVPVDEFRGLEFVVGTPDQVAERILGCARAGYGTVVAQTAAPLDTETIGRLVTEVRPMVDAAL